MKNAFWFTASFLALLFFALLANRIAGPQDLAVVATSYVLMIALWAWTIRVTT